MENNQEEYQRIISRLAKNHNEKIHLKREYHNTLISVVGVCFGVLVAMKDSTASQLSNYFYFAGIVCCATSLVLLIIGARGAIIAHDNRHAELGDELMASLGLSTKKQKQKSLIGYKLCTLIGLILFFATIILFCLYSYFILL